MTPTLDLYGDCVLWPERDGPITDTLWAMDMRTTRRDPDALTTFGVKPYQYGWYIASVHLGVKNDPPGRSVDGPYETLDVVLAIAAMRGYYPDAAKTAAGLPGLVRD